MRPTIVGDIHRNSEVAIMNAETPVRSPSTVCQRWRRTMSRSGIEPSSRRCGCQPVSRPSRIWNTEPDWITIRIGAMRAESRISITVEATSRTAPPARRRPSAFESISTSPKNFGAKSTAMVTPNSASARSGSNRGHCGKSVNSRLKYSGRM